MTMLLFPILLDFLRTRMPHLIAHPALLAHTVYQTVLFDDAVRESGFELARTSIYRGTETAWDGLAGVILREGDWFVEWLAGEKKCEMQDSRKALTPSRREPAQRDHLLSVRLDHLRRTGRRRRPKRGAGHGECAPGPLPP